MFNKLILLVINMEIEDKNETPKFVLKKWNAVVVWSWNTNIEKCAICK